MTMKLIFQGNLKDYISVSIEADNWKAVKSIVKWAGKSFTRGGGGSGVRVSILKYLFTLLNIQINDNNPKQSLRIFLLRM